METKEFIRQNNNKGALINIDTPGLKNYKSKRNMLAAVKNQEERIDRLESSLEEIKGLLVKILETGNNK